MDTVFLAKRYGLPLMASAFCVGYCFCLCPYQLRKIYQGERKILIMSLSYCQDNTLLTPLGSLVACIVIFTSLAGYRKWLGNQQFSVRSIGSTFLGNFVTTVIGLGGDYFHQQPLNTHLLTMTFAELLASYILASLITPPASLLVRYLIRAKAS